MESTVEMITTAPPNGSKVSADLTFGVCIGIIRTNERQVDTLTTTWAYANLFITLKRLLVFQHSQQHKALTTTSFCLSCCKLIYLSSSKCQNKLGNSCSIGYKGRSHPSPSRLHLQAFLLTESDS